jgi:hypothetical protein
VRLPGVQQLPVADSQSTRKSPDSSASRRQPRVDLSPLRLNGMPYRVGMTVGRATMAVGDDNHFGRRRASLTSTNPYLHT